jgi:hypothetical protein
MIHAPTRWMLALLIGGTLSAFAAAANVDPALRSTDDGSAIESATTMAATADDSTALVESVATDAAAAGVVTQASSEAALR